MTEELPDPKKRELVSRRGQFASKITRTEKKVTELCGAAIDELDVHNIDTYQTALTEHWASWETLHYLIQDTCEVDRAKEDTHLEKIESQVERQLVKLKTAQTKAIVHSNLLNIRGELEMLATDEVDRHQATSLGLLRARFEAAKEMGGRHTTTNLTLSTITTDITKRLQKAERSMSIAMSPADVDVPPTDSGVRDRDPRAFHRRLPTIQIPKFGGDYLEWGDFWTAFERTVHNNKDLDDGEKRTYLQQAVKDQAQTNLVDTLSVPYLECIASLKARYNQPRKLHQHYTRAYFNCTACKDMSKSEITRVHATLSRARTQLANSKYYTLDAAMESYAEGLMPPEMWKEWSKQERDQTKIPKIDDLLTFLEFQATLASDTASPSPRPRKEKHEGPRQETQDKPRYEKARGKGHHSPYPKREAFATGKSWPDCKLCGKGSHPMYVCTTYLAYNLQQRQDYVQKAKLCANCLGESHAVAVCRNSYRCRDCGGKHNSTLHKPTDTAADSGATPEVMMARPRSKKASDTISPTMEVTVHSPEGDQIDVTALFDLGATISLVTDDVVDQLGLKRRHSDMQVVGVNGDKVNQTSPATVSLTLTSPHKPGGRLNTRAFVVPRIGGGQGGRIEDGDWSALEGLQLANPNFQRPSRLDVLLGNDVLGKLELMDGIRKDRHGYLVVRNTIFGWVVNGRVSNAKHCSPNTNNYVCATTGQELTTELLAVQQKTSDCIREFFQSESMPEEFTQNEEDAAALTHYTQTHKILPNGYFQVSLPKLKEHKELGRSRAQAVHRYMNNEKSLLRKGRLEQFQTVMREYLTLGHAELVPVNELPRPDREIFYLPMHSVFKESTTSPLRVVFDASANTSSGISLNDILMTGPTVYPALTTILIRFRTHDIALTADIGKMFRCIMMDPKDRRLHRFVWRESANDPLRDYQMTRVTFGVSCSPFLATQTLQQISCNVADSHSLASTALHNHFYVDDYIAGAATEEQALKIQQELQETLGAHGLLIRKWRSNSTEVLKGIPVELQEATPDTKPYGPQDHLKTLGIHWNALDDSFHVSTSKLQTTTVTKRSLASDVAQTFDVLGWFAPATILMKLMIQDLWRSNHDWDDPTTDETRKQWSQWKDELPHLASHPLPRRYFHAGTQPISKELHGFADASLKGYAAVVYLRATYTESPPTVSLVMAKTKVTPVKGTTVPRLELCAALLLAELITHVRKALDLTEANLQCWSDSQVVLFWLDGRRRKNRAYVSNRVNRTLELVPSTRWRHVPGVENPADCASRGISPVELLNHPLWWHGPEWLHTEPYQCPPQPHLDHLTRDDTIVKEMVALVEQGRSLLILDRSSTYDKTRITLAWIRRYLHNSRARITKEVKRSGKQLLLKEIIQAETQLYLQAQRRMFPAKHPEKWLTDKTTRGLNPKADGDGVYRVDGRLHNSELACRARHPVILRGTDPLTLQIITHHHLTTLHGGPAQVLTSLSQAYYLIHGMAVVKSVCRRCVTCIRFRADREHQLMGQLPAYRVTPGHAFGVVGTDFAGPISLSEGKARRRKGYICVFVCLKTKAIHLEVVTGLGTKDFLACLRRFVARRGKPTHILSDNGTNFVGAARELDSMFEAMNSEEMQESVSKFCTSQRIEWIFNPARAPHFGGLWEATVKSVKFHLKRIEARRYFTYQEMATILAQIEAVLNSRPLMAIHSHSPEGLEVLTAGHFLIGRPLTALPEKPQPDTGNLPRRWDSCQQATQRFWAEWSKDYLQIFHHRGKWQKPARNVCVGDIVILRDEPNYSIAHWPLAKVIKVYPGADGLVRAVDLKVGTGIKTRPIVKLTVLVPVEMETEESTDDFFAVRSSPGEDVPVQDRKI